MVPGSGFFAFGLCRLTTTGGGFTNSDNGQIAARADSVPHVMPSPTSRSPTNKHRVRIFSPSP